MLVKILRQCHLMIAAITAILLLCICISGALLVYGHELQRALAPSEWRVTPQTQTLRLSELVTEVEKHTGSHIRQIRLQDESDLAWQVFLNDMTAVNLNPYTGEVIKHYRYSETFYGVIMLFHRWLLYKNDDGERPFKVFISIASLMLIIEILIGLWLWLKPKKPLKRLKINWKAKPKVLLYQLHITLGVICSLPLILIAFSGMTFHWKDATQAVVKTLTFSDITKVEAPKIEQTGPLVSVDKAYQTILDNLDGAKLQRLSFAHNNALMSGRVQLENEFFPHSMRWVDMNTGQLVQKFDAVDQSAATATWNFRYVFHVGSFGGHFTKILWLILTLLPVFLVISGGYFYVKRQRKGKKS
ncbi:PepSY-associated TM helix domain-containing protein [Pseudoalteromonas sp. MMG022]|uniref:PepSY-associated TM helix domain-containing protein n=1 Tax=Pseudoalteromonas sp. MMG022 TaxID=2909978 RepID=UPI001F2D543C|nr:PepSY-associated TM helix domain-containing protein [Pseudoalteromonas sp. MMG022]MCF6436918.1 PepSY domain-containing protein [Pseudoalteromonas sp. MMG022]